MGTRLNHVTVTPPTTDPILLLSLQLLDALQQAVFGAVEVISQAGDGNFIRLLLRSRHLNINLEADGGGVAQIKKKQTTCGAPPMPQTMNTNLKFIHHLTDSTSFLSDDVAMKLKRHFHLDSHRNQSLGEENQLVNRAAAVGKYVQICSDPDL